MAIGAASELLNERLVDHVLKDVESAVRRKPANEPRVAGVVRTLAPYSEKVRDTIATCTDTFIRRGSFDRILFMACIRALAEVGDDRAGELVSKALSSDEESAGFSTLLAASYVRGPSVVEPLARVAKSKHPHLAFVAEVARAARGECDGTHLTAIAPKIKESQRIAMCLDVFVPLSKSNRLPPSVAPSLSVLRDAERHLGRWLVLAEVATRASDPRPLEEASERSKSGSSSSKAAWALAAWALSNNPSPPTARPTIELVARLSDRPSAERDMAFLFRLAAARVPSCRPMLESAIKGLPLEDDVSVRAACFLVRDHNRENMREALIATAKTSKREDLRGLAIAALWDADEREIALDLANQTAKSRSLPTAAWAGLVQAAKEQEWDTLLVREAPFRRIQLGWLE